MELKSDRDATPGRRVLSFGACIAVLTASVVSAPSLPPSRHVGAGPGFPPATAADQRREGAQEPKPQAQHVTGKVVDKDGNAVERAEVSFDGPKKQKVFTDARGQFAFTGPAGDYVVVVKAGDRRGEFKVKIENDELKPSTLIIDPEGPA